MLSFNAKLNKQILVLKEKKNTGNQRDFKAVNEKSGSFIDVSK